MGTFKGKRIIPKHDGVWNRKKEYEELTIVLDAESGDGYISRKPVPAGTVLSDTDYWSLCSHFNAQMYRLETDVAEDVEEMHRSLSETESAMHKEISEAESRVNTKVSDAQNAMQKTEDAMNTAVEQMNKRLDANVIASTDSKADYAAELVDVRVGQDGTVYPSAGEAIRGQYSLAVENGITGAKLALAGSNGNLGEVFPKAAMPALLGAKCEAGEFLDYRITGTTDYGQFYHRFTNMLMGKFRKYLFISKIREISGSCAGVSCYQYDSKGANLNTHVTKAIRVAHGSESYVVFFGEILENAYRLDISPCVARKEAVVECDSRCVLLDVTGQSDEELQKVLSLISSSPVEDSILQYYDTWGIAGKVMSVPYADRTGISDQAREMLGNVAYPVWRCKQKMGKREGEKPRQNGTPDQKLYCREKHGRLSDAERKAANERCPSESIHECALEQSFMEMLYRLKRDYEKNHEASEISTLFHKACEQMYQQMKGNSVSVERLETLDAQIKELEEKLQETIGRQVTAMRDAVLEQNLELNESLAEGNITLDEIDSDIRNGLTGNDIGTSFYHADYEEGSEIEAYASLAKDIRQRIESFRKEKETLSQEQGALTVMKKNFDLFIACLKELPEQNAAGMPLKVNGLDVQGSLFRDVDGKPVDGAVASLKRGRLKMTPERIAEAPDLLHFEKGIYCAFMKKGTVKGDIVLYETNFGVTLPTCGNQRTLTSFLGFKKCSLDGLVTLVDAPYRVYDNTVQYRRYLRSKAKREQAV